MSKLKTVNPRAFQYRATEQRTIAFIPDPVRGADAEISFVNLGVEFDETGIDPDVILRFLGSGPDGHSVLRLDRASAHNLAAQLGSVPAESVVPSRPQYRELQVITRYTGGKQD